MGQKTKNTESGIEDRGWWRWWRWWRRSDCDHGALFGKIRGLVGDINIETSSGAAARGEGAARSVGPSTEMNEKA